MSTASKYETICNTVEIKHLAIHSQNCQVTLGTTNVGMIKIKQVREIVYLRQDELVLCRPQVGKL